MAERIDGQQHPNIDLGLVAYLLPGIGSLYLLIFRRQDDFAIFHARQGLLLIAAALLIPLVWAVVAWLLSWIPYGALASAFLFSLVIAAYAALIYAWLVGIANVLKAEQKSLPFVGYWFVRS